MCNNEQETTPEEGKDANQGLSGFCRPRAQEKYGNPKPNNHEEQKHTHYRPDHPQQLAEQFTQYLT
jgi:hypothetical protein